MTLDQGQLTPLRWAQPEPGASVTVTVPASSANLGPGFDSVGLALGVWDEATVTVTDEPGVVVEVQGEGVGAVPLDESHLVVRTLAATFAHLGLHASGLLFRRFFNLFVFEVFRHIVGLTTLLFNLFHIRFSFNLNTA